MDVRNIKQVFIGNNISRTSSVQITDPNNTTTYIAKGEIVIVGPNNAVLTSSTAIKSVEYIRVVQRAKDGDAIYYSSPLRGADIKEYFIRKYCAATEKIVNIGYNGASGNSSVTLAANTTYWLQLFPRQLESLCHRKPKTFAYTSGASTPTDIEVYGGLVKNLNLDCDNNTNFNVKATLLSNGAGSAITGTGTLTIAKGSKILTAGTDIDAVMAVGDYIRLDESVGASPATTDGVYKIVALNTTTKKATLDRAYTGTSLNAAAEGNGVYIPAATALASEAGIKIEGLAFEYQKNNYPYIKEQFDVVLSENIIDLPVVTQVASKGCGTYPETTDLEWYNKTNNAEVPRFESTFLASYPQDTISTETYDYITIKFVADVNDTLSQGGYHQGDVVIAIAVGAGQADTGTSSIQEVLNKYIVNQYAIGSNITVS